MKDSCAAVLGFLRSRGADGATEAEIQAATGIRSGGQRVHELKREHGFEITTVMERSAAGATFARWTLVEEPTGWGQPVGRLRRCPSCRRDHHVGTACAARAAV